MAKVTIFLSTLPARGSTTTSRRFPPHVKFLSTLPARGATLVFVFQAADKRQISIHAPREGSDQQLDAVDPLILQFLSTLPARGAT